MKIWFRYAMWTLFISLSAPLLVQGGSLQSKLRFSTPLETHNSLSHQLSGINTIAQDAHGFIWLGGENGLGRFDGRTVRFYRAAPGVAGALPSNFIWELMIDHAGHMWLGSRGGLSRYSTTTDTFETFEGFGGTRFIGNSVFALAEDAEKYLYLGTSSGLYRVNPSRDQMKRFVPDPPLQKTTTAEQIRDVAIAPDGKVWLATAGMGVAIFDPATQSFQYLLHDAANSQSIASNNVKTLEILDDGSVWIGTYDSGITVYGHDGTFKHFSHDPNAIGALESPVVWDIHQDASGVMWVTLDQGGLARWNNSTGQFEHFRHNAGDRTSVASNQLRAIFEDRNSDLWIGAYPSGVSFYDRSTQLFRTYRAQPDDERSLNDSAITALLEDSQGTLWVGTEGGLHAMNRRDGTFTRYLADSQNPHALMANPVLALEEDSWGNLWVGTWAGGLHRFERESGKFYRYQPREGDETSIGSKFIWDILEDSQKRLWIATETNGLNRYNRDADNFTRFPHDPANPQSASGNFIWTFMEDSHQNLWLGTFAGLDVLNPQRQEYRHFPYGVGQPQSTSSKYIRAFLEDSRGLIWVSVQDFGVDIYNPQTDSFSRLDVNQGLPSSNIASIVEDDNGDIWLATSNGLAHVRYPSMTVTTYGEEHGLAGSNFNRNAAMKDAEGKLYFGSTDGLTVFHPKDLSARNATFPVKITSLRILNEEVTPAPASPLQRAIVETDSLVLDYRDIMFSFSFAALNYRNASANSYAYRLDGFDRDWNHVDNMTTATYTNLDPGTYRFRVKATNGGDRWNESEPIEVTVLPPPWRTWWAYAGYSAMAGLGLYFRREYRHMRTNAETYKVKSITDPLTNLYNRAGISQVVNALYASAETRRDVAVMLIDIDHFKHFNDAYGHDAGDKILCKLAEIVSETIRRGDYFGRWGGEEFILICPSSDASAAVNIAEKIRQAIERAPFTNESTPVDVTISIGVAVTSPNETFDEVLKKADTALYQSKGRGRNTVTVL